MQLEMLQRRSLRKGQASIELVVISAAVIMLVAMVSGYFLEIKDSTTAVALAKKGLVESLDKQDNFYIVERVEFQQTVSGLLILDAKVVPEFKPSDGFSSEDCEEIAQEIIDTTKYNSVEFNVKNGTNVDTCNVS